MYSLSLQAETAIDFSTWLQALRSWNPQQVKASTGNTKKVSQHSTTTSTNNKVTVSICCI